MLSLPDVRYPGLSAIAFVNSVGKVERDGSEAMRTLVA